MGQPRRAEEAGIDTPPKTWPEVFADARAACDQSDLRLSSAWDLGLIVSVFAAQRAYGQQGQRARWPTPYLNSTPRWKPSCWKTSSSCKDKNYDYSGAPYR
jgi:hypothetical protein